MLAIEKKHIPLLVCNSLVIVFFSLQFISDRNYEFLSYVVSVIAFAGIITYTHQHVKYSMFLLSLLSFGILIHLGWGGITINGQALYNSMIFPISGTYSLIRYDQLAHAYGFFTATILSYELIQYQFKNITLNFWMLVIIAMAACGFWALNEIVEFIVDQSVPTSWVGWYINTSVDLVVNLIGSILWVVFIKLFLEQKSA